MFVPPKLLKLHTLIPTSHRLGGVLRPQGYFWNLLLHSPQNQKTCLKKKSVTSESHMFAKFLPEKWETQPQILALVCGEQSIGFFLNACGTNAAEEHGRGKVIWVCYNWISTMIGNNLGSFQRWLWDTKIHCLCQRPAIESLKADIQ